MPFFSQLEFTYLIPVVIVLVVKMCRASIFHMDGDIAVTKYHKLTRETFAARGNVIVRLSETLVEIGRYRVGNEFERDVECESNPFEENCPPHSNSITILEIFESNQNEMLFVCLKFGEDNCYIFNTVSNESFPVPFDRNNEDFFIHFAETSPTSFLIETRPSSGSRVRYLTLAHNINLKHTINSVKFAFFSVFSLIKISLDNVTNTAPSFELLSEYKLHIDHNFYVVDGFQSNGVAYYVVKYWDQNGVTYDAIVQLKHQNDQARLIETRIICAENFLIEQSSLLVEKDNETLFFLTRQNGSGSQMMICDIWLPRLKKHFDDIVEDCLGKQKGSYPNWLNLSQSARSRGPCDYQVKDRANMKH